LAAASVALAGKGAADAHVSKDQASAAYARGMQLFKAAQMDAAADALCEAAKVGPDEAAGQRAKYDVACATAIMQTSNWERAEAYFQAAQQADGSYPLTYSGWGSFAEKKGDFAAAAEHYQRYLGLEHDAKRRATFEQRLAAVKAKAGTGGPATSAGGGATAIVPVDAGDCGKICGKLIQCNAGPWSAKDDCEQACDGAREDKVASKTYRCAAQAKSCKAVAACAR
jgi:tetratricopeptide (TPR) repeat protein